MSMQDNNQRSGGMKKSFKGRHGLICRVSRIALFAMVSGAAAPAWADPQDQGEKQAAALDEIVVTGTRVARQGYDAPTPTTVIDQARLLEAAPANIADFVNQLPALVGSNTPRRGTSGAGAEAGSNFFDMRALGPNRTLVLLDGHRVVPTSDIGAVDANLLPQALVQRVDVITGGASAAWGSDAVAGVVNYVLDRTFTGVKTGAQYGISNEGDAKSFKGELSVGSPFAEGRGHVIVSGEYHSEGGAGFPDSRDWFTSRKTVLNPAWTPTNGQPRRLVADHVGKSNQTTGGLITGPRTVMVSGVSTANPLYNKQFGPNGELLPFNPGLVTGIQAIGGDSQDVGGRIRLALPLRYGTAYGRVSYELTPDITVFGEAGYGKARNDVVGRAFEITNQVIRADNAYLPAAVKQQMAQLGLSTINVGRMFLDMGGVSGRSKRAQQRYVAGAEGVFGDGWSWDSYFQHGRTHFSFGGFDNNPILANFDRAVDAVVGPDGRIVCRSTLTDRNNFCAPFNIFGEGNMSQAALDYVNGNAVQNVRFGQDVGAFTLRGEPFAIWAGPVSTAIGAEYRRESYRSTADSLSLVDAHYVGNYKPAHGSYTVKDLFAEAVVPLAQGLPFLEQLDLNGAVRFTDYSTSGSVATWKLGATWDLDDQFRIRGVASRDIRAANLAEKFAAGITLNQTIDDPVTNSSYSIRAITTGNRDLAPEKADTRSLGFVYRPSWLDGLSLSADYYDIKIKGSITTLEATNVLARCAAGSTDQCGFITRNAAGLITHITLLPQNLNAERARGIDFEAGWQGDLGDIGRLSLRSVASYADERSVTANGITVNYAGDNANEQRFPTAVPRWRLLSSATLDTGSFSTTLTNRFIGAGHLHREFKEGVDIDNNRVKAVSYFDLTATYTLGGIGDQTQIYASIYNLLNQDPPASPNWSTSSTIQSGVNGYLYDVIGRQFRVGVRSKF